MKHWSLIILMVVIISGCSSAPVLNSSRSTQPGTEGFYEVKKLQQFSKAHIKQQDALQGYARVMYSELDISKMVIDDSRLDNSNDYWELQEGDVEKAKQLFAEQLSKFYKSDRNLTLSNTPDDSTLQVEITLTKFRPNAPRDNMQGRTSGESYLTEGPGLLYMTTKISDAKTGSLLAVLEDDRELGTVWEKNIRINNVRRFKMGLYTWIERIDKAVSELQQF